VPPATAGVVKANVTPTHTGAVVITGAAGIGLITIDLVSVPVHPFTSVTDTVIPYVPATADALKIGEDKLVPPLSSAAAAPVHVCEKYGPPVIARVIAVPAHTVKFGVAVITGLRFALTVTTKSERELSHPLTVCDT
jgi:hypothetical protein